MSDLPISREQLDRFETLLKLQCVQLHHVLYATTALLMALPLSPATTPQFIETVGGQLAESKKLLDNVLTMVKRGERAETESKTTAERQKAQAEAEEALAAAIAKTSGGFKN